MEPILRTGSLRTTSPHCTKRDPTKLEGRATVGMLIMLIVLSLLGWVYLTQASFVATTSRHIQDLEEQKACLEEGNLELVAQIADQESVSRLATRAAELGFEAVAPGDANFVAIAPAASNILPAAHIQPRESTSGGAQKTVALVPPAKSEPGANSVLGGVKAQFWAWVQAEGQ